MTGPPQQGAAITILIPTYNGARFLERLLPRLVEQERRATAIVVVDSNSTDRTVEIAAEFGCQVHVIPKSEFNHAATRNHLASLTQDEIIVFLSQDVLPLNNRWLANLVRPIEEREAVASYSRQVAGTDAYPTETYLRQFNYPLESHVRGLSAVDDLGLRAFFFSNAASAFRREAFWSVNGFKVGTIQNEDMIMCARLLRAGHQVAYCADAEVEHTHNYGLRQQFKRYFDIGAATKEANDDLKVGASVRTGSKFALEQVRWLWRHGHRRWIPFGIAESGAKYLGYMMGRNHPMLPRPVKKKLSMHSYHWDQNHKP